jgi:site-specific DNA recombinase
MNAAAIYARVSTDEQGKGFSLSTQVKQCLAAAEQKGYTISSDYIFEDQFTGASMERPGLDRLRRLAQSGAIERVFVLETDRLARKAAYIVLIEEEFEKLRAPIEYVLEQYDNSPEGMLQRSIRGVIAEYEKAKTRQRSLRNKKERIERGFVLVGVMAPYGYSYVKGQHQGWLQINEEEARIVRLIFEWYVYGDDLGQKLGSCAIAARLSQMGVPTRFDAQGKTKRRKQGGTWSISTVKHILQNETYAGVWHYGKHQRTAHSTHARRNRDEWMPVSVPAIITRELYEAAQRQSQINLVRAKRNSRYSYLLQGRLSCPTCGRAFHCEADTRDQATTGNRFYYRCPGQRRAYSDDFAHCSCSRSLRADVWDERVWKRLEGVLKNPDRIMNEVRTRTELVDEEVGKLQGWLDTLEGKIEQIVEKRARLVDMALDTELSSALTKEMLTEKAKQLADEQRRYEYEAAQLRTRKEKAAEATPDEEGIRRTCAKISSGIDMFTADDRRAVIEMLDITGIVQRGGTPKEDEIVLSGLIPAFSVSATPDADQDGIADTISVNYANRLQRPPGPA